MCSTCFSRELSQYSTIFVWGLSRTTSCLIFCHLLLVFRFVHSSPYLPRIASACVFNNRNVGFVKIGFVIISKPRGHLFGTPPPGLELSYRCRRPSVHFDSLPPGTQTPWDCTVCINPETKKVTQGGGATYAMPCTQRGRLADRQTNGNGRIDWGRYMTGKITAISSRAKHQRQDQAASVGNECGVGGCDFCV